MSDNSAVAQSANILFNAERYKNSRCFVFCGHFGSGKSEVSANFALNLSQYGRTAIVDFDIINPYYRTSDAAEVFKAAGVKLIAPRFAGTNADVPALPAEARSLFDDDGYRAVFDVGGDDLGARAVASFHNEFTRVSSINFFVYNAKRPMTSTTQRAADAFFEIMSAARVPFHAIVNNTNLMSMTTAYDLESGLDGAMALSDAVGVPLAFSSIMRSCEAGKSSAANNVPDALPSARTRTTASDEDQPLTGLPDEWRAFAEKSAALGAPVLLMNRVILMP